MLELKERFERLLKRPTFSRTVNDGVKLVKFIAENGMGQPQYGFRSVGSASKRILFLNIDEHKLAYYEAGDAFKTQIRIKGAVIDIEAFLSRLESRADFVEDEGTPL